MSLLKDIFETQLFRRKKRVTLKEFISALEADLGRSMDSESVLFFSSHPVTVSIVHQILSGRLKKTRDATKNEFVVNALLVDMADYMFGRIPAESPTFMADLVREFSVKYKDAGNIVGQSLVTFLNLRETAPKQ